MAQELNTTFSVPAAPLPEQVPVVIVGAGPVGLSLGLALAGYGIKSVILDDEAKLSDGSRAICIQRHTLQIFERLGVVDAMMAKGLTWRLGRVFFGEQELYQIRFPGGSDERYPPFINLQQYYTEQYLIEGLSRQNLCELHWQHKVTGLRQDANGVAVTVETPDGTRLIRAEYVMGADGARSPVRHMLGLNFVGKTYPDQFLIVDIKAKLDYPDERWFWFDPLFNRGKSALVHPQPEGVWRLDWQLGPHIDAEAARQPQNLDRRIRQVIGDRPYEVVWASVYTFHQRHAERFRVGRVFLLGDAAHLMSPFGARGMNSGVQDAYNLAWKLWLVKSGRAPEALLDSYDTERRAAAQENLRITDGTMAFITPHGRLALLKRNLILRGSVRFKRLRKLVNAGRLSTPCTYQRSPLIDRQLYLPLPARLRKEPALLKAAWQFRRGPVAGSLAPDAPYYEVGQPAEQKRLVDLIGPHFTLLYFTDKPAEAAGMLKQALANRPDLPLRVYLVASTPADTGDFEVLWDKDGRVAHIYAARPRTLYVLRPDGHIAARGLDFPLAELGTVLRQAAGWTGAEVKAAR